LDLDLLSCAGDQRTVPRKDPGDVAGSDLTRIAGDKAGTCVVKDSGDCPWQKPGHVGCSTFNLNSRVDADVQFRFWP
jgi:hypothetical protein